LAEFRSKIGATIVPEMKEEFELRTLKRTKHVNMKTDRRWEDREPKNAIS
jgi:hypothetical protein